MTSLGYPTQLKYHIVDVFTETPLQGNGLAVVFDTMGLRTERMQAIAREFNLSETTFIQRRDPAIEKREGVRVRIFTTQEELPFAGHPTLGTASVLKQHAPELLIDHTVLLALNVGPIPVRFKTETLFGEMTQRNPEFLDQLDPCEVARLCGLRAEDLHPAVPPQIVSTGTAFAIVALRSHEPLYRLRVDQEPATRYLREHGGRWFYVMGPTGGDAPAWRARMQFYGGEDPATGSAAGCAISYLVGHKIVTAGKQIHVQQGVEIGRTSDLFLAADVLDGKVTNVRVAGSTVPVAKGTIFLP
ncbi:PhzF family phenazine biosynthesis protein [Occallatibacter savannae]|uniref:PhzF family phenazine biosynthesis protein n=1 Tax=Occallatibacter savannae TaxID=1002691 RepID=UPI000D697DDD|nr:PhzF family phenazine biosynthesis protein [Occallatibacter savannae]